jgi:pimeloyl-ACP methyl ester carboxylesterase
LLEPFKIAVPDDVLEDLGHRLDATRLRSVEKEGWEEGTDPAYLSQLIDYWRNGYDWRTHEAKLNNFFRHLRGIVDGATLHLIHEKGRGPAPLPLILTHGYPDSFFRFYKLIPLLTDPAAHGGDPADAFDIVAPSLPGYAFSEARVDKGALFGFGDLWRRLMVDELGYEKFGAHGGDWGTTVTEHLARSHAGSVVGIHLTDVPFWHIFQRPTNPRSRNENIWTRSGASKRRAAHTR